MVAIFQVLNTSRTLVVLAFYSRRDWHENTNYYSGLQHANIPLKSSTTNKVKEEPLYNGDVSEYDPENMPAIPSTAETNKKPISSSATALDPKRVALIIETRPLLTLPAIISQFISNVPVTWIVRFVGTTDAFFSVKRSASLSRHIKSGKLILTEIPDSYPVNSSETLSATLTNLTFYSEFLSPAEWLLMFQSDSIICSASEQSLDDWVDKGYSWVGAPWNLNAPGGNGGLSLRHVPSIINVLKNQTREADTDWEDRWLCDRLPNTAPPNISKTFSVESVYYERPLGYHLRGSGKLIDQAIWQNKTRKRQIFKYCPETKIILGNMGLESPSEAEDEKNENDPNASAIAAAFKGIATKILSENGKQPPQTQPPAPITTDVAAIS